MHAGDRRINQDSSIFNGGKPTRSGDIDKTAIIKAHESAEVAIKSGSHRVPSAI